MRSTLACEASSAARAFDRGTYVRTMLYEIENGWEQLWNRDLEEGENREQWNSGLRLSHASGRRPGDFL